MANKQSYPLEIIDVDPDLTKEVNNHRAWPSQFIRIGPNRYFINQNFMKEAAKIYNMEIRPTDTWVVSTPRSGTTLMQELIWQLSHDLDFDKSALVPLGEKFPFLEYCTLISPDFVEQMVREKPEFAAKYRDMKASAVDKLDSQTTNRFIKTHLAFSLLPPGLVDTAKVVYITRNPLDSAVSYYHMQRSFKAGFHKFWQFFVNGTLYGLPFFSHVKEAWAKKDHPNMLFLFYEEVIKDVPKAIRRVASFLGKNITEEQVSRLAEHLELENCKKNPAMNRDDLRKVGWTTNPDRQNFIREGKSGGWRSYFDVDMTRQAEQWITDNLQDTDLRFPDY